MSGLPILSNSTSFVHSEQMFGLDGPIRLGKSTATGGWQIENRSQLHLRTVGLLRKKGDTVHGVWVGELSPGQSASISDPARFPELPDQRAPFQVERSEERQRSAGPQLNLEPLLKLAYDAAYIDDGETRLIARLAEPLAGETVRPSASQLRTGTLVLAHLEYAAPSVPRHDVNTRQDVKIINEE